MKEIFQEREYDAIILLNNGNGIPIQRMNTRKSACIELKTFVKIFDELIEENKSKKNYVEKSEDKFDKLIKLGEMYDKGLLSDEKFFSLKQELLS